MNAMAERVKAARRAGQQLGRSAPEARNRTLLAVAESLRRDMDRILAANAADLEVCGLSGAPRARLALDPAKLEALAKMMASVAAQPDPLGQVDLDRWLDEGLRLTRRTVPLGVLGVVFESRPDAALQIPALALKSGNGVLLKGGREAARSVAALVDLLHGAMAQEGLPAEAVQILEGRSDVDALLACPEPVDLLVARGSAELVHSLRARTSIPVMGHAEGRCHLYVDRGADLGMALALTLDAKLQMPSACNALETLLVHREVAAQLVPALARAMTAAGGSLRGCGEACALAPMEAATPEDWDTEHGAPILNLRVVPDLEEALAHIARHGSRHTEGVVTADEGVAARFNAEVDAATVTHNASTRFADGYRFGFGAELGISTGRLHARGPVGLEGLVTRQYEVRGAGHAVGSYVGPGARPFLHRDVAPFPPA